ncbi:hypothetical protein FFLO_03471 [Filobasidium floriforme]|uniref:Secreted protein n=1 Tax=Filobasidium floriforme TaxID=5210 RepID=A0A8K0JMM9_9TREE|nr:hypothetical protein FFLO_03471 [Filobasidium floriforme]
MALKRINKVSLLFRLFLFGFPSLHRHHIVHHTVGYANRSMYRRAVCGKKAIRPQDTLKGMGCVTMRKDRMTRVGQVRGMERFAGWKGSRDGQVRGMECSGVSFGCSSVIPPEGITGRLGRITRSSLIL